MLSVIVFLPLVGAVVLLGLPRLADTPARWTWVGVTAVDLALTAVAWARYRTPAPGTLALEEKARWIPGVNSSYHLGVDGLSLPLIVMTAVIFFACAVYGLRARDRPKPLAALFLFLQTVSLGLFVAADLILFFVFFDLSIVAMYFVIAGWGHGNAGRSALKFFLYTFLGSLALLVGFIGLSIAARPHTFDMVKLAATTPLSGRPLAGGLVLAAILLGLAVKTPTFPFHTWLPPAHTDAPAVGSAVLAGVLLKMGTYGFVRIAMPMLPQAWRAWAWVIIVVGVVSVLYGALVALAQNDFKRMVAYTSVNHMGYIVLAVGTAGLVTSGAAVARGVAVTGAVTQMVSHGLITGALFLIAGVFYERARTYDMHAYGGLAGPAPKMAWLFAIGAFASLGLPGFSGFIAEFQIFTGSIAAAPVTAVALPGILIVAALFLVALQRLFTGPTRGRSAGFADLSLSETWSVGILLALSVVIGVFPRPLLELIEPAARALVGWVGR
ncbi:MAG: NADH-quinone oxidoreductase subunit M [Mycobacterium pseudokansasii]|uniref:NAD(P)H-quinone oxidoreductase chain 4 1 n=1 Tax=Mycobacterium pseudokansasii TaxID=2341080 RepID=A0A498QMQ9_9MYCO|nr:NADH-quinone oxidoreductase subunit M [Mycobacterium pseudokansasii]KZS65080.1 oxidoreductase [Mycobacterium kansasii]MBY0389935.1 NADH-quinone oxidoreductase subunit M [Mycobacterium pseudokansasii]VAZ93734.1 NAD(P)H-quinone oxidoreductase chain 4 1 [Mycobacterium pseudokansasii]VAZ94715.1 NAD(P)H-quinone oxidoreductase chain 4 1 [Mycobacterium pseudokansasii]VBA49976.1 NAD(P)H-quinone oxidoreductase chain 4 1 [Mycobacterium pseudokansasii]